MYLKTIDGNVVFATYFITTVIPNEQRNLFPFQIEQNGIVCYSEEEKNQVEGLLTQYNISYITESLSFTDEQITKVKDKKYKSRTEAIQHLQDEIEEPESEIIPKLKREKKELEQRLKQTESALLTVMFGRK
jgi:Arc/MetJ-type ribon-helix-helix transcriptional regulator